MPTSRSKLSTMSYVLTLELPMACLGEGESRGDGEGDIVEEGDGGDGKGGIVAKAPALFNWPSVGGTDSLEPGSPPNMGNLDSFRGVIRDRPRLCSTLNAESNATMALSKDGEKDSGEGEGEGEGEEDIGEKTSFLMVAGLSSSAPLLAAASLSAFTLVSLSEL